MKDVIVPQFGETVEEEIVISEWHKQVGDTVEVGELLVTIETGKAEMDVESIWAGTITDIVAPNGAEVKPLDIIAHIS